LPRFSSTANTLFNWTAMLVAIATGLVVTPLIISHLGKPLYGAWSLVLTIVGYSALLNVGVTPAISHYVAIYRGQKDTAAMAGVISNGLILLALLCALVVGGAWLAAEPVSELLDPSGQMRQTFATMLRLGGLGAACSFLGVYFMSILQAYELFLPNNAVVAFYHVYRTVAIAVVLGLGHGPIGLMAAHISAEALKALLHAVLCYRLLPHLRPDWRAFSPRTGLMLISFGALSTLLSVGDLLRFQLDQAVIGKFLDFTQIAIYAVAAMLVRYMLRIVGAFVDVLTPRLTSLTGGGHAAMTTELFLRSLTISSTISLILCAGLVLLGWPFLRLWLGQGFQGSVAVLWILAVSFTADLMQAPAVSVMFARERHGLLAAINMIEGACNLALSIYLAPRMGIVGVALGTAAPMLVNKLLVQPLVVSRELGLSYWRYWRPVGLPLVLMALVTAAGFALGLPYDNTMGWLGFLGWAVAVAAPFAAFMVFTLMRHGVDLTRGAGQPTP